MSPDRYRTGGKAQKKKTQPQNTTKTMLQVIMLLLGGFAIAGALSKHFIAKSMATAILSRVGRQPHWVLLANMLVATFLSMFISNVAAPVLCFGLVQPILRTYAAGWSCCLLIPTGSFAHLRTHALTHSLTHSLTHTLTHSLTHTVGTCSPSKLTV